MNIDQAIDHVLSAASRRSVPVEILANERKNTSVSIQGRKVEQFSFAETRQLGVRVVDGNHEGLAYSESLDTHSLDEMLDEAVSNSRAIEKEQAASLRAAGTLPKMDFIYNRELDRVAPEAKVQEALNMEAAALDYDQRISNVAYALYRDVWIRNTIANSNGLRSSFQANSCSAGVLCLAKDGDGNVSAGEFTVSRDFARLGASENARHAAKRTLDRLGARRPATGRYTVVFENRIAEHLVGMIGGYFSAKAVDEGTSPMKGKLGLKVFSPAFTLYDDPAHPMGNASRPFDDEGYAGAKLPLVQNGQVMNFLTNSVLASKMKLPHTAHASRAPSTDLGISPSNLIVEPGSQDLPELLQADRRVILITNIMGTAGFRATSGDFSLPVEGFLYEDGHQVHGLKDFLISGNMLQLLNSVEGVGKDTLMPLGSVICPSLLVRDLNVSGAS